VYTAAKRAVKAVVPEPTWTRFYEKNYWLLRPLIIDRCPVMPPWAATRSKESPIDILHRIATGSFGGRQYSSRRIFITIIACAVWPARILLLAGEELRRHGKAVRRQYGVGLIAQLAGMLRIALTSNLAPLSYYRFRLFRPENASRAHEYLQGEELDELHEALTGTLPSLEPLDDKELFFQHGRAHGLPVVPIVASFDPVQGERWYDDRCVPQCDLIVKPAHELCGRGVTRWTWCAETFTWSRGATTLGETALIDSCRTAGRSKKVLLQRCVRNHSALAALAPGGLATLRVVTYRRPSGEAGLIMCALRMPTNGQPVDNFAAGGIAAPVDATGVMLAAVAKDPDPGTFPRHPDSGAPIAGIGIPHFGEAIGLALRAHAAFAWVPTVGWDVVITPEGPALLEANPGWCFELAQIAPDRPLGATPYPEVFLEHLAARSGSRDVASADRLSGAPAM
jgi:hypothetical protein